MKYHDHLISAISSSEEIRGVAITSKDLIDDKTKEQGLSPIASAAIGRLMSAALMMGSWLKNDQDELTLDIAGDGLLSHLDAVSNRKGEVRGYVSKKDIALPPNERGHIDVGGAIGKGHLTVIRNMGMKTPYVSSIALISGEIAEDLTAYFAQSEQTPSIVGLGVHFDKKTGTVDHAGGFIVQLLPNVLEETISKLEGNLKGLKAVTEILKDSQDDPKRLLESVLQGFDLEFASPINAKMTCSCSKEKGRRILRALPLEELEEMAKEGKSVQIGCSFCEKRYEYPLEEIERIIQKKRNDKKKSHRMN